MKRAIVVSVRETDLEDKQTKVKESVLFVTMYRLPSKMKNGGLWYPKNTEAVSTACFNKNKQADDFAKYKDLPVGSICDVTYGLNDFNGKTFVASINVVKESPFSSADLYI